MKSGLQRAALVAYLFLSVYLLAQTTPEKVLTITQTLDKTGATTEPKVFSVALGKALKIEPDTIQLALEKHGQKPSALACAQLIATKKNEPFEEVLPKCRKEFDPINTLTESRIPLDDALDYLLSVEAQVSSALSGSHDRNNPSKPNSSMVSLGQ
ncbi:MAG: hypothetical protein SFY81_00385 [Verrucomicrobiota bacterium]|nr:hypothetical protein [Verrucomicrobiota bacterium]